MKRFSLRISLIAAMGANRVIGNGPDIPWKIPGEQKIFRQLTEGKVLVMGRKTFESIGRPLPHRTTIVISRQEGYEAWGCPVEKSFEEALLSAKDLSDELFVAGGAEIYALAMPLAHRIYLTEIHQAFEGDIYFPEFNVSEFHKVSVEEVTATISYTRSIYERKYLQSHQD